MVTKTSGSGWTSAVNTTRPRSFSDGSPKDAYPPGLVSATVVTAPPAAGVDAEDLIEALVEAAADERHAAENVQRGVAHRGLRACVVDDRPEGTVGLREEDPAHAGIVEAALERDLRTPCRHLIHDEGRGRFRSGCYIG
jgi:hypothetical protein